MSYVTKFHPQYPNGYQPWPVISYQGSCSEGTFESISSDCTKYNQCVNGDFIQFGCADGLHWNSALNTCDWPANVINIRPECDKTFKTFGRRKQFGRKLNTSTQGSATSDSSKTTSDNKVMDEEVKVR